MLQAAEEQSEKKITHAEKIKAREDIFFAASQAGKTVKGVIVEGNSLFNGTTAPQDKPYGQPYTAEELRAAKFSAERNSKVFIFSKVDLADQSGFIQLPNFHGFISRMNLKLPAFNTLNFFFECNYFHLSHKIFIGKHKNKRDAKHIPLNNS